jgi:hypothetical protein
MRLSPASDRREGSERLRRAVFIDTDIAAPDAVLLYSAADVVPALCRPIDAGYLIIVAGQPPADATQAVAGAALAQWSDALVASCAAADAILAAPLGPRSHVLPRRPTIRRPAEAAARGRRAA